MIQPFRSLSARLGRRSISSDDVGQRAGDQHLVGGAEVGAPVDLQAGSGATCRQASSPSSITTMLSAPDSDRLRSRRPVVIVDRARRCRSARSGGPRRAPARC